MKRIVSETSLIDVEWLMPCDNDAPDAQELLHVASAWAEAMVSNDAERIGSYMAEEWTMVSNTGVADKRQFLSLVVPDDLTHESFDMAGGPRVRRYGDIALLTARLTNTARYQGPRFDSGNT